MFLKQHRKATLELVGRKLKGTFDISLTNARDLEVLDEMLVEIRKARRKIKKK